MILNILSNVWFYYYNNDNIINSNIINNINNIENNIDNNNNNLVILKKLQNKYNINKIINLDDEFKFWWIPRDTYEYELEQSIVNHNIQKIEKKLNKYCDLIMSSNLNNQHNILFISNHSIECMIIFNLYLYIKYTNISNTDKNLTLILIEQIKKKYNYSGQLDNNLKMILL